MIARRRGTASAAGGLFDHATDCLFVAAGLAGGAARGAFPWVLPALVVAAFAQYVADSYWLHRGRSLRGSRLGRWNGILYFAPLVGDILVRLGWTWLRPALTLLASRGGQDEKQAAQFALLHDNHLWIAAHRLGKLAIQPAGNQLASRSVTLLASPCSHRGIG